MSNPLLEAALAYASDGKRVFPLKPRDKVPATAHGLKDATTDEATIREWWTRTPDANIGFATGNGVAVVDIDDLGPWTDLLEDANAPVPDTSRVITSRGFQLYFRTDAPIRNSAGKLRPGIDIRGDGGYVVLPPSVHPDGTVYRWEKNGVPDELPAWLLERLTAKPQLSNAFDNSDRQPPVFGESPYGLAALEAEVGLVAGAIEGTRRDTLNTAGLRLGGLVAGGLLDEADVRAQLWDAARLTGLGDAEIEKTLKHAIEDGKASPRGAPEQLPRRRGESPIRTEERVIDHTITTATGKAQGGRGRSNVAFSLIDLRTLKVKAVRWIEKPYLSRGELHILQGHGSAGKGALTCLWAAEASLRQEHVVMVCAEDDLEAQIKPRLIAAGADFEYVHILAVHIEGIEDALEIPADLPMLEELIRNTGARLVTIDPLMTHIASKTDSYKDHDIKRVLTPLSKLAQRTGCAIVGVHHFKKDTSGGARFAGQASTAFGTTARIVLSMAKAIDGSHVMEISKSNIGPEGLGLAFQVSIAAVPADDGGTAEVPLLMRDGLATQTVDQILSAPKGDSNSGKARRLILAALADVDHIESDELDARIAKESGLSARTVRDLRMELRGEGLIRSIAVKDEFGKVTSWNVSRTNAAPTAGEEE